MANTVHQGNRNNAAATQQEKKKKRGAGFYVGIVIAAIAIILALMFAAFMFMNSTQASNRGGAAGQLEGKTAEEIQAELDKVVGEGMFNISIASIVDFPDGTSEGEVKIENSPANRYLMQVDMMLEDGTVIYESPILEPNYHIQTAKLSKDLDPGTYEVTAVFHALDPQTEQEVGQAAANVAINVLG